MMDYRIDSVIEAIDTLFRSRGIKPYFGDYLLADGNECSFEISTELPFAKKSGDKYFLRVDIRRCSPFGEAFDMTISCKCKLKGKYAKAGKKIILDGRDYMLNKKKDVISFTGFCASDNDDSVERTMDLFLNLMMHPKSVTLVPDKYLLYKFFKRKGGSSVSIPMFSRINHDEEHDDSSIDRLCALLRDSEEFDVDDDLVHSDAEDDVGTGVSFDPDEKVDIPEPDTDEDIKAFEEFMAATIEADMKTDAECERVAEDNSWIDTVLGPCSTDSIKVHEKHRPWFKMVREDGSEVEIDTEPAIVDKRPIAIVIGEELKKHVIGQNEYVERLAIHIQEQLIAGITTPILVIGKSGSGKTFTLTSLMEYCKEYLPKGYGYKYVDCSSLTEKGFKGDDVGDIFDGIDFEQGIIFLDEIDKIVRPSHSSSGDNVNLPIQNEIMNYISGKIIKGKYGKKLSTKKFLFVLGGAFPELYELHEKRTHSIGFVSEAPTTICEVKDKSYSTCKISNLAADDSIDITIEDDTKANVDLRNDLVRIGASREFVGRIGTVVTLKSLSREDFRTILLTDILPAKVKSVFAGYRINVELSDSAVDAIVEAAVQNEYGARIIKSSVDEVINKVIYPTMAQVTKLYDDPDIASTRLAIDYVDNSYTYDISVMDA